MPRNRLLPALAVLSLVGAPAWSAPVTLLYTGNAFDTFSTTGAVTPYDNSNRVTVSVTLASALGAGFSGSVTPTAFSLSDGIVTVDQTSATNSGFSFITDASGVVTQWEVEATIFAPVAGGGVVKGVETSNISTLVFDLGSDVQCGETSTSGACAYFGANYTARQGRKFDSPGTWAVAATPGAIPEPPALALAGLALSLMAVAARRRRAR